MEGGNAELSGVKSFGDVLLCFFFRLDFYFNFSNQGLSPFKFTFPLYSLSNHLSKNSTPRGFTVLFSNGMLLLFLKIINLKKVSTFESL